MAGASSAFRMGDGVMEKWKVFRRKSVDAVAMYASLHGFYSCSPISKFDINRIATGY
jgi:hypothetical protein